MKRFKTMREKENILNIVIIRFKGAPPATPLILRGRDLCTRTGGWVKCTGICASDISARASTPLDERRRYLAIQKSGAKATPRKLSCKRGKGLCEGGLRRHVKRSYKALDDRKRCKELNSLANHCEEETEAGGRIPSFPQTAWRPSHPPAGGQWRGNAPNLDI